MWGEEASSSLEILSKVELQLLCRAGGCWSPCLGWESCCCTRVGWFLASKKWFPVVVCSHGDVLLSCLSWAVCLKCLWARAWLFSSCHAGISDYFTLILSRSVSASPVAKAGGCCKMALARTPTSPRAAASDFAASLFQTTCCSRTCRMALLLQLAFNG